MCVKRKEARIMSAHCSCRAGMSGACNHVAAMLFRMEAAVRLGLTKQSCTAKSWEWLPNQKEVKPRKLKTCLLAMPLVNVDRSQGS